MNVSPQEQATLFILVPCGQTLHIHAMAARPLPRIRNVTPSQLTRCVIPLPCSITPSACRCVALPNDSRRANFIFRFVIPRPACDDSRKGSTSTVPDTGKPSPTGESSRMKLALGPYIRFSRILLFPLAMVIYDFLLI